MEEILYNINEYRNNEYDLVKALRPYGVLTYDAFERAIGEYGIALSISMRADVEHAFNTLEDAEWQQACSSHTVEAYYNYLAQYPNGKYVAQVGDKINCINLQVECEAAWQSLDKTDEIALGEFINKYPWSDHTYEAQEIINSLHKDDTTVPANGPDTNNPAIAELTRLIKRIRIDKTINNPEQAIYDTIVNYLNAGSITGTDLMNAIKEDNNFISSHVAYALQAYNVVPDFRSTGIPDEFLQYVREGKYFEPFPPLPPITKMTKNPCTEVYFWGIPSSGKTCAIGSILSAANNGEVVNSMEPDSQCQGYGYLLRLANLFRTKVPVGVLPQGNAITATYEMGFNLEDKDEKIHPITFVDLAGELIGAMYKYNAREALTNQEENALKLLTNQLLKNKPNNKKLHFFVIEYGAEDRYFNGLPQDILLAATAEYIKRANIFEQNTDAVYVLITKVDKVNATGQELMVKLKDYMLENYRGFYKTLQTICRHKNINNGVVEIKPFTIGQVCFQNFCKFKDEASADIVRILLNRTKGYSYKELDKLTKF